MPLSLADVLSAQVGGGPVYEGGPDANVTPGGLLSALGTTWPAKMGQDIVQGLMAPGNAYQSTPGNPVTTEQMIAPATNLAGVLVGSGMPAAESGAAGIFGGKLAKTADLDALKAAQDMIATGRNPMETYQKTGWFKGPDQQWRFEINDRGMGLSPPASVAHANADFGSYPYFHNADVVMNHPELFQAYPDLWKVNARLEKSNRAGDLPYGAYERYESGKEGIKINAAYPPQASSLMLHELQHAIQQREGFAGGADFNAVGRDAYQRSAGEVEARNVQRRWDMTPEERKTKPPWITQDYPYSQQIIKQLSDILGTGE